MDKKKIIYKIISFLIVVAIFFFLGKSLVDNWHKVKDYQFSFNYFYLLLSFLFLFASLLWQGVVWNKILRILEPEKAISHLKAIKLFVYSWFGRYLPGKAWMYMARAYLATEEGISKKSLAISIIYEVILSIAAAFIFSAVLLSIVFGFVLSNFYFIPVVIAVGGLIFIHPKILNYLYRFLPKKIKVVDLSVSDFLSYFHIIKIVLNYSFSYFLSGVGFFFLINSIAFLPFRDIVGIIGAFILASILGIVALFAPSGLGVREGFLVLFLKFYFPISLAILIALIARLWATLGEIIIFISIFLYSKIKKI